MRREFYAFAGEQKLADLVLDLLDEEIADDTKAKLAGPRPRAADGTRF